MCIDANFHHRHRSAVQSTSFTYEPEYFISKSDVDSIGNRISAERPHHEPRQPLQVPLGAVEECERSHKAANGNKEKVNANVFDDMGICALVCCHDIPLFICNVDTPGEQQKYAVALMLRLFEHIPPIATVISMYDIGCTMDKSCNNVSSRRLTTGDMIVNFYCHVFYSVRYNPRLNIGSLEMDVPCRTRISAPLGMPAMLQPSSAQRARIERLRGL